MTAVFVGLTTLDVIHRVTAVPDANQKIVSGQTLLAAGGPAANAAIAHVHCGGRARLVTALPAHALSEVILADLADCGVDVVVADATGVGAPTTATILVTESTGERAVISPTGPASAVRDTPADLDPASAVDGATALMLDGYHPHLAVPLARAARAAGVPVIMDGGSYKPHTPTLLEWVDVAVVSADFAPPGVAPTPDAVLAYLLGYGVAMAAVSRGERPLVYRTTDGGGEVPVEPVEVVDTLGAGDVLHGALTYRIATLGLDPGRFAADLAWASRVAAVSVCSFGTRAWLEQPLPASSASSPPT